MAITRSKKSKTGKAGSISSSKVLISKSAKQTERFAARLAKNLAGGALIALTGELGGGKTTFVRGLAKGLGSRAVVQSPTFVLIHEYVGRVKLYHFDFYRIESLAELDEIGVDELFNGKGICVVEWANRFPEAFPKDTLWIDFHHSGKKMRHLTFNAQGASRKWISGVGILQ
jgi:tRNA threonylcarbamoyladenosine biosynthesis protein TsaE